MHKKMRPNSFQLEDCVLLEDDSKFITNLNGEINSIKSTLFRYEIGLYEINVKFITKT